MEYPCPSLLLVSALLFCGELRAQEAFYYRADVPELTHRLEMKEMYTAVADLGGHATCAPDTVLHSVELFSPVAIDPVLFTEVLTAHGFTLSTFVRTNEEGGLLPLPDPNAFPAFVDTGDPVHDNAIYDAAKAAWIASHPEQYSEMTQGKYSK